MEGLIHFHSMFLTRVVTIIIILVNSCFINNSMTIGKRDIETEVSHVPQETKPGTEFTSLLHLIPEIGQECFIISQEIKWRHHMSRLLIESEFSMIRSPLLLYDK